MEATLMKVLGVISTTAVFLLLGAAVPAFAQEEHHEEAAKPATHEEAAKPAKQEEAKPAKQEEAKPAKQEEAAKPAKQEEAKPVKREAAAKPARQEEAKPAKQEEAKTEKPAKQVRPAKQEEQAKAKPAKQEEEAKAKPAKQEEAAKAKPVKQEKQAKPAEHEKQAKSENQEGRGNTVGKEHGQPQRSAAAQQKQRSEPALRLSARSSARIPDDRFRANFGAEHTFVINQPVLVGGFSRFQYGGFWFGFENPWPEGWYYTDNVYVDYIDGGYYLCNPYYPGARVGISVVI
jgi:hypothetical protein